MAKNSFRVTASFLLILTMSLMQIACEESPTGTEAQQPVPPPLSSMQTDFSLFTGGSQSMTKGQILTKQHFVAAAATVTLVNAAVIVHMALPVVLFGQAINQDAEFQNDGKFHWIFSNDMYTSDLAGWIDVDNAESAWEMYYTQGENFNDFLWFMGRCNFDGTEGEWIFNHLAIPDAYTQLLRIDWTNNAEDDRTLDFTIILDGDPANGDKLMYTVDGTNRNVQYYDASAATTAMIAWDAVTGAGYIQLPNYNNGLPGYWDENQNDLP